jgi:hypothetical protein
MRGGGLPGARRGAGSIGRRGWRRGGLDTEHRHDGGLPGQLDVDRRRACATTPQRDGEHPEDEQSRSGSPRRGQERPLAP